MTHRGTCTLTTPRLVLRRFTEADAPAMFTRWASDPEVTAYLRWNPHANADITRGVLADWVANYERADYYQWAIVPADDTAPIGSIGVVRQDDNCEMFHIGYCLGRAWWGKGMASEALAAVMRFLFCEVGAMRVESQHAPENPRSGAVMRRCGMVYEQTTYADDYNTRGVCDSVHYAISRTAYFQQQK